MKQILIKKLYLNLRTYASAFSYIYDKFAIRNMLKPALPIIFTDNDCGDDFLVTQLEAKYSRYAIAYVVKLDLLFLIELFFSCMDS